MSLSTEEMLAKWGPVLDHQDLPSIEDKNKRSITAQILENTEIALNEGTAWSTNTLLTEAAPANATGTGIANYNPVLISLVRRSMPNLVSYDIMGVQPMTGPTGLVFSLRPRYNSQTGTQAFYNESNTAFSGAGTQAGETGIASTANTGTGMATATVEALGDYANNYFPEMAFDIASFSVVAKSRAMRAEFTTELAQDLKAIHGLDAEKELTNILSAEILADINREALRTVYNTAIQGSDSLTGVATAGIFDLDVDANGRWSVEKFKGLMFHIEQEANRIAKTTRRGRGNIVVCSSDVASALRMAGVLDNAPALAKNNNMTVDDTGNTFVGVLNGQFKVYIDPYAGGNYMIVGYKGSSPFDAGIYYCPYVPLQMVRAVGGETFQPKIGFKTRYGLVSNPFAEGTTEGKGALNANTNLYYRRTLVTNLM